MTLMGMQCQTQLPIFFTFHVFVLLVYRMRKKLRKLLSLAICTGKKWAGFWQISRLDQVKPKTLKIIAIKNLILNLIQSVFLPQKLEEWKK